MARVMVKARKARPFWFGHPWVFSGAIGRIKGRVQDGDLVELCDQGGQPIGFGFFNSQSQIRVRMLSLGPEAPKLPDLLEERLRRALELRQELLQLPARNSVYRLAHGEGDGLPGLVVDRLGDYLVVQLSLLGLLPHLEPLLDLLQEELCPKGILERPSSVAALEEGLKRPFALQRGTAPPAAVTVREEGLIYRCDPVGGQKTGFFADQRENRVRLAPLARGKQVLDAFSYVGGFGLRMAQAGAESVHLVDSSAPALKLALEGACQNGLQEQVTSERGNVLRVLDHYRREGRVFDLVVVDPPRLVHRRKDLERGLRLYAEINQKAVSVLREEGILITSSCSQHVQEQAFEEMLGAVAKESQARFQEIYRGGQGPDHPVLLPLQESRYLKVRALLVRRQAPEVAFKRPEPEPTL